MSENHVTTLQALLQFALPLGTILASGSPETTINWSVTVRAQPPAFPDIYGGELALVSMDVLRSYNSRLMLAEVVQGLAQAGVNAIAAIDDISDNAIAVANECQVGLLGLPDDSNLTRIERSVNTLIANYTSQLNQRAMEIQRQLTRLAAENRDLNSLLQIVARATARPVVVHDDAGVLMAQVYPNVSRRVGGTGRALLQSLPYGAFQNWLERDAPDTEGAIVSSPLGYTTILKVEKRVAGYLSLVDKQTPLDEFDRLVMTYGADVCAIELAKNRAIAFAVEQARGDWVQMWLSGTPADDDLLTTRAQQSGFDTTSMYLVAVFRASTKSGTPLPLESLISLVRDDMVRRQVNGAVGQYVDVIVALYPLENASQTMRLRRLIDEVREQLASRTPSGLVGVGISRPAQGLSYLRESYREAKDAVSIANELGEREQTTFYGDLKLFQLLLALKERNLDHLRRFNSETLGLLIEHDERKQGDLIRTLNGFFQANGNLAKAAADLDVHRNTLVYRLERIAELTDMNLDDPDNRLILHLALKIQRVLATISGS
ncbi:MAG: helix-turn-helix domain-containing protein [Anaerolineae bacterium]|nr:helix-turn-helix domain-containing protein [Anaerolineae bacterium]MBN8617756.1 helix-turn-helix domain-containing protein [Anaerolineae bacterium]